MRPFSRRAQNKLSRVILSGVLITFILIVMISNLMAFWSQIKAENDSVFNRLEHLKVQVKKMDSDGRTTEETRVFSEKIELLNKSIGLRKVSFNDHLAFIENHLPDSLRCFEVGFSHQDSRFHLKLDLSKASEDDLTEFVRRLEANPNYQSVRVKPIGNLKDMKRELYGILIEHP